MKPDMSNGLRGEMMDVRKKEGSQRDWSFEREIED
jgi:hypothetical protein